jgi:hypothetical protein
LEARVGIEPTHKGFADLYAERRKMPSLNEDKPSLYHAKLAFGRCLVTQQLISPQEYETLLKALKERIRSAQLQALRSVNSELISLYADIGRMIVEKQQGTVALTGAAVVWSF